MRTCRQCGGSMEGRAKQARVCSQECRIIEFNTRTSDALKKQREAEGSRKCNWCDVSIDHMAQQAKYCTDLCGHRANNDSSRDEINRRQNAKKSESVIYAMRLIEKARHFRIKGEELEMIALDILDMHIGYPTAEINDFLVEVLDE